MLKRRPGQPSTLLVRFHMSSRLPRALGRKILVAACAIVAVAGPAGIGVARAQKPVGPLKFEVASIKLVGSDGARGGLEILPGGGLHMEGVTLKGLVTLAYDIHPNQLSGGPRWADSEAYQLLAKPEREPADEKPGRVAPGTPAWDRLRERLRNLLAERFQLVVHKDSKEVAGYALVVTKGGSKLQESKDETPPGTMRAPGKIEGRNGTMHMLATVLTQYLGRPVEDRTGLTGAYTYKLEYAQDFGPGRGAPGDSAQTAPPDIGGPSIFSALQNQLGLRLESAKVALETFVIDRAEKPSDN